MIERIAEDERIVLDRMEVDQDALNETPELVEESFVEVGDLWTLGNHRLLCGDSTNAGAVALLLDGEEPFILVTDPPYGVGYDPNWRTEAAEQGQLSHGSPARIGEVENDDRADWSEAYSLFPGSVIYSWSPGGDLSIVTGKAVQDAGFSIRAQVIWRKPNFAISRGHYNYSHEPCWYGVRFGKTAKWQGDNSASTVWDITLDKNAGGEVGNHGTQKPVECMRRPIANHGGESDDVYDPFLGSGTTIIACESLGRRCFAIEILPAYVQQSLQRYLDLTSSEPILVETGETFEQVKKRRGG